MRALRAVAGTVGLAVVAVAAGLVFGVVPPERVSSLSAVADAVDGGQLLAVLAATLLLAGLWFARRRSGPDSDADRFADLAETPPEGVAAPASIRVGGGFDRTVGDAVTAAADEAMRAVASRLRETAVGLYADVTDADAETARRRVRDGTWTDDELAAAFLAEDRTTPFRSRIRAWLDPARERRRRVDAATSALFELREGVVPDVEPRDESDGRSDADGAGRGDGGAEDASDGTESGGDGTSGADDGDGPTDDRSDGDDSWVARVDGGSR